MTYGPDFEAMAQAMEATGEYKVLRRLRPRPAYAPAVGVPIRLGLVVDVETTGLDPSRDEIIELAMMSFSYGLDGTVFSISDSFQKLREPSHPIAPEITAITGIDDAMVAGQSIDPAEVAAFAAPAAVRGERGSFVFAVACSSFCRSARLQRKTALSHEPPL